MAESESYNLGDHIRWTAAGVRGSGNSIRSDGWPAGARIEDGETYEGEIHDLYDALPGFRDVDGEYVPPSEPWASIILDNGATRGVDLDELTHS